MATIIFIFFSAFALIAAFENCEKCVDGGKKYFLSLSGHASCGKQEFRTQLSAKDSEGCLSLEKLIVKLKIPVSLDEGLLSTIPPSITSASPPTTTLSELENSTEFYVHTTVIPNIRLQNSTEIPMETTFTPSILENSTGLHEETTISPSILLQNFTESLPTTFSPKNNTGNQLTTTAVPILMTTTLTRKQPRRCVEITKTGEDRLNRIWRSAARSFILIEKAKMRNYPIPSELLIWNSLNPVSMI